MNGSASPKHSHKREDGHSNPLSHVREGTNGTRSPELAGTRRRSVSVQQAAASNQTAVAENAGLRAQHGDDDLASEAETLIDSPVKKREAERQKVAVRAERPARSRIGGLPVPGEDDEESSSAATPVQSTETSEMKISHDDREDGDEMDIVSDKEGSSGSLSSPPSPASTAGGLSLISGHSRAMSEGPEPSRNGAGSPNPRKRKHRASSVGLPNKRQSMEPPKRALRGLHSEDSAGKLDRSPSPKLRNHRRAVSTQSALLDGSSESGTRKRKTVPQFPVRDPKSAKSWEESDASSETTSHGNIEARRPQRGVGRSTSTPGRPVGREHKRHINKYGFTRLAEAAETEDIEQVKVWREKDPDQLEIADYAQNKPLQIAAIRGFADIVEYLIDQGCQIDCANVDKDTPLIDAAEDGHLDVVKILLRAGVDPLRQNLKGQQALDVITDGETENADEIRAALREAIDSWNSSDAKQRREEEEETRHKAGPSKELHFMARSYENLMKLVTINDRNGVQEFLNARVPVDNMIIAAAVKTGDQYLVNMLLAEMTEKKAYQKPEKPMLAVLGTSHFEMVKMLTELDQFNPTWRSRAGKTWVEISEERNGPNWRQEHELLQRLYDERARSAGGRRSSSPVTKRESAKRRLPPRREDEDDESDDEDGPKPKNGRRLMSRRAMRAASGKAALSDSDSEEDSTSDADAAGDPEMSMKPPDVPTQRRGSVSTRQRTKSLSAQPPPPNELSPRTRRRSSSLRGLQEHILPTVEEKPEAMEVSEAEKERIRAAEEEARVAEVQRLEAEAAEAEAKRAEEEARIAEETRKADEARAEAEAARIREAEEQARQAEEARKADEERRRKELEMEGARSDFRRDVLSILPGSFTHALSSDIGGTFLTDTRILDRWPLHAIREEEDRSVWLSNVEVAPILGRRGTELLLPRGHELGFERTFCKAWDVRDDLTKGEHARVREVIRQMIDGNDAFDEINGDIEMADDDSEALRLEANRNRRRREKNNEAVERFFSGAIPVELVRLSDALAQLGGPVEVISCPRNTPQKAVSNPIGFLESLRTQWELSPITRTFKGDIETPTAPRVGHTPVMIVHEK